MPLDKQVVGVNFTRGLDTHTDKRLVIPGKMVALQNASMSEQETLQRRNGSTVLVTGSAFGGLGALDSELLAIDGRTLKSYAASPQALYSKGSVSGLTITAADGLFSTGAWQDYADAATDGALTCYVWRETNSALATYSLRVAVRDESTGAIVLDSTSISTTGFRPRVVCVTGAFIIFYGDAGNLVRARVIATSAPTSVGAETSIRTDLAAGTSTVAIDACASGANAFLVYSSNDATYSLRAVTVTRSGTTPSVSAGPADVLTAAAIPAANIRAAAIANYTASALGVFAIMDGGVAAGNRGLLAAVVSSAMAVTSAAAQKDASGVAATADPGSVHLCAALTGSNLQVFYDFFNSNGVGTPPALTSIRTTTLTSANAIAAGPAALATGVLTANGTNGPFIAGKPLSLGGSLYLPAQTRSMGTATLQNAWWLLDTSGVVAGKALYGTLGKPADTNYELCPSALALSATTAAIMVPRITLLSFDSGTNVSLTGMARLDLAALNPSPPIRGVLGPTLFVAGAALETYDTKAAGEAGYHTFPEYVAVATGGAGNVTVGVHQVVALYEWTDATGQRWQSAPSIPIEYNAPGGATSLVSVENLMLTQKVTVSANNSVVVVYATTAGGATFHRVNAVNAPAYSSTAGAVAQIAFNVADGTPATSTTPATGLQAGELLYTTGGILPNNGPPPCSALAIHQNRVFINVSDDPFSFQYSQPWVAGFGVQWNETLRGRVESTGGPVTAFASVDDKLIVFRPRRIGVLFGNGPTTTGALNGYNLQDLPTDVGCSEPRSVLVMPEGVIFKSTSKGWYILGRDLQLRWIGEGVQEWDSQGVTSAVLLDTEHECRFTTNDASGLTLVYFYPHEPGEQGQWGTYSNYTGVDAVWWPGGNAYVRATATKLIKELPATSNGYAYGDEATTTTGGTGGTSPAAFTGTAIPMVFQTGWLKPGEALQAFQRIWRVLLTGAAVGYPPEAYTTITQDVQSGADELTVASGTAFGDSGVVWINYGNSTYEAFSILSSTATTIQLDGNTASDHFIGEVVRTAVVETGALGTLEVKFYFDGDDSAAFQTITISDVSELVNGNAWNVRLQPNLQKCDAIMMKVTSTPSTLDPGASLNFSGMTMELGVKKGAKKFNASQTK